MLLFLYKCIGQENELQEKTNNFIRDIKLKFPEDTSNFGTSSGSINLYELESFPLLVQSGPGIIPVILDSDAKIPLEDKNIHYGLHVAYKVLSRVDFSPEKNPWTDGNIIMEWYGGYELAEERFLLLQERLKTSIKVENKKMISDAMVTMGIYIFPFLMKDIQKGNEEYRSIFEKIISRGKKWNNIDTILAWWEKNKNEYTPHPQNKKMFHYFPASPILDPTKKYNITDKIEKLYSLWVKRHLVSDNVHQLQQEKERQVIALSQLIGYENTLQFRFLVDLGEEALPYLFLFCNGIR
jgi:hypothetical protein